MNLEAVRLGQEHQRGCDTPIPNGATHQLRVHTHTHTHTRTHARAHANVARWRGVNKLAAPFPLEGQGVANCNGSNEG